MTLSGSTVSVLIRNSFGNKVLWGEAERMGLESSRIRGGSRIGLKSNQDDSGEGCGHGETRGQQSVCDLNMVCSGGGGRRPTGEPWPLGASLIPCLCDLLPHRCKVSSRVVS